MLLLVLRTQTPKMDHKEIKNIYQFQFHRYYGFVNFHLWNIVRRNGENDDKKGKTISILEEKLKSKNIYRQQPKSLCKYD